MKYNPYSVSKIGSFNTCPKKFYFTYILKIKHEANSIALFRGVYMHLVLENKFNYNIDYKLNDIFTIEEKNKCIEILETFRKTKLGINYNNLINNKNTILEEDFGFKINNKILEVTSFKDSEAWFRGAIDLYHITNNKITIVDWKSGKEKSKINDFGIDQATVYAVYIFTKYKYINNISVRFVFIEHSTHKEILFSRDGLNTYIRKLYNLTKVVEDSTNFISSVSALCDYCPYNETNCTASSELEDSVNDVLDGKCIF